MSSDFPTDAKRVWKGVVLRLFIVVDMEASLRSRQPTHYVSETISFLWFLIEPDTGHVEVLASMQYHPTWEYCNATRHIDCNCNCNWGTCIAPPTGRPRAHHRVNPYPGARRQNETVMFSDHDETSPSITAVSAASVACSMLAVQQRKRFCCQFVDVSAAWRGCHMMNETDLYSYTVTL